METLGEMKKEHKLSVAVFKEFPWREYSKVAIEQSQLTFRTPYLDNELIEVMYRAPTGVRASNEAQRHIIGDCNPTLSNIMTDRGVVSETNSLFSRFVELYYYLIFKADYIYLFDPPPWLTKLDSIYMSINGGRQVLGYQKFEYYRIWFRNELSSYIKEILLDKQTASRQYFDKASLEIMLHKHIKGSRNYLNEINKAMTVELIHRLFIDA
jgi:asparagine synthase (glutamine-hydrolysing)